MKEPVDHIIRPQLPWRTSEEGAITECGHDASKVKAITRDEFLQRFKDFGRQRTALFTCMTCAETANRYGTWQDDPRIAIQRETVWERGEAYWRVARNDRGDRLKRELLAIASLIEAHREEFDAFQQRLNWLDKKAALAQKKSTPEPRLTGVTL